MAKGDLEFLLKSYCFLDQALSKHAADMISDDRARLEQERAQTFAKLLAQRSDDPAVVLLQLRTLIDCLAHSPGDAELTTKIADISRQHLEQLACVLPTRKTPPPQPALTPMPTISSLAPDADLLKMFDASSDRIVIMDREYRYRFANKANAAFHEKPAEAFVDRPLWAMTCETFFARVTKPVFDRCFAGQTMAFVTSHPGRDPSELHSGHLDPIFDHKGRVVGALVVARKIEASGEVHSAR